MFTYYIIFAILLAIGSFFNRNILLRKIMLVAFLLLQTGIAVYGFLNLHKTEMEFFTYDSLGIIFLCVLTILSYTTIYHSYIYLQHRKDNTRNQSLYFFALILLIISMTCVYLANHLGVLWVFIEATTLSVAVLIYHERTQLSLEATWKYVFICSIGITFAFVGIIFLSKGLQGSGSSSLILADIPAHLKNANVFWLKLAFIFMLVGFSTKMGLFPMHTIAVDAHTVAPPPISAFISTTLMNVGFISIFRTYSLMAGTSIQPWMNSILLWCGLLSIFVSVVYILKVNHLKRMFAYSSLEHMGLAAIGIATGGIGYFAAIFHMVLHSFVKASVFYQIDQIHRVFHTYILSKTGNYFSKNITGAIVMLILLISITAMPPSGLFVSEFLIFRSMFEAHQIMALLFILVLFTLVMWALGKNILKMLFVPSSHPIETKEPLKIRPIESVSQFVLLAGAIYLGLNPPAQLVNLINESIMLLPK
ncbi:MAG: hypothetical protein A2275_11740 [Bacteroidetes bacterium RIFOXYA12_FULL_35_11]|nr:MAG: hypothetical protein A2X01_09560 [Bacteroidetes bacterium GWF2_35_48]OFY72660.1 MAG: hypothetical protein A2275_11740 [Bacteroidetes bacterium RIFOXYA12_FULL_35_11]OFY94309.1 MAG: hypothetical protein A2309_11770 [Bacteroidetes bacterium RIFOXYB2_FULL_35_7]OFY95443.1 MAG: hypothetical protein A2491_09615 [Bacteroidetes bacterium RIFOXYC12_FULL_35_7]HBX50168.1 hypothetical protein [Bacteroidales bacterium]